MSSSINSENGGASSPKDESQSPSDSRVYDPEMARQAMRDLGRKSFGIEIPPEVTDTHEMLGMMIRSLPHTDVTPR